MKALVYEGAKSLALRDVPDWGGFSSVTATADGKLLALTEGAWDAARNTRGWLWDGRSGATVWLRSAFPWLAVDLALLPDGDLLLAEVRPGREDGDYDSRLSRIPRADVRPGATMRAEPLAEFHRPFFRDRIEAVSARRGAQGETLVYALSDVGPGRATRLMLFALSE